MDKRVGFCMLVATLIGCVKLCAQNVVTSTGTAQIKQESNVGSEQAKKEVLKLAKINAIEQAFGTYVEQDVRMTIKNDKTYFNVLGGTKVKGEWIQTIGEPKIRYEMREVKTSTGTEPEIWWLCEVKGKIRELTKAKVSFVTHSLRKPNLDTRTDKFVNNEDFYLYFRSPENGFLSVYIASERLAYRLLPYAAMDGNYQNSVPVKADKEYIFFDPASSEEYFPDYPKDKVDELKMYTEQEVEVNELYIVFSKNQFSKPILEDATATDDYILPKSLSMSRFEEWLEDNSAASVDFAYKRMVFEIAKD